MIKKDVFKHGRMFGRVAKIIISNTFSELVEMDFVDYGDRAAFSTRSRHILAISRIGIYRGFEKGWRNAEMARGKVISNWSAAFWAPEIIAVDKAPMPIGEVFQDFCTSRNIVLQSVIPGRHQSLGAAERRHGHFRMIIDYTIGGKKKKISYVGRVGGISRYDYEAPKFTGAEV